MGLALDLPLNCNPGVADKAREVARFTAKIKVDESGCWMWQASKTPKGYGCFTARVDGKLRTVRAHGYSFRTFVGEVPAGLELHHDCRKRACVNPEHLEPVTHAENLQHIDHSTVQRVARPPKVQCVHGHRYTQRNTYRTPDGTRECMVCRRRQRRKYNRKLRAKA